jgi:hypothetical protein
MASLQDAPKDILVIRPVKLPLLALLLMTAACSPDHEITRTAHVSAERLAEISKQPYMMRYQSGGGPAARLAGVKDDPWPDGILFLSYGPYLEDLGFAKRQMLVEIDGKNVGDIFYDRWKDMRIKRPGGFHQDHYKDLISYLFDKKPGDERVLTVYVNVPGSEKEIGSYRPEVEHWQIIFDH